MSSSDWIRDRLLESASIKERAARTLSSDIEKAGEVLIRAFRTGRKLLIFGNGGSAADSQHLAAEFVGRFLRERSPLPAIALTTDTSALTAIGNDYGFDQIFRRQVLALGRSGDVALGLSTSGRSPNVIEAMKAARESGLSTLAFTGEGGGGMSRVADIAIIVPSSVTARIQECHIAIGHVLCEYVDDRLADGKKG